MDANTINNFLAWANQSEVPLLGYTPSANASLTESAKFPLAKYITPSAPVNVLPSSSRQFYVDTRNIASDALKYPLAKYISPSAPINVLPSGLKPFRIDSNNVAYPPRSMPNVSLGNVAKGALGITGLAAIADAVYNKDESALAYLLGMGPGSLVASTPLNAGENEQLAFMERQRAAEQAHELEPVVDRLAQQVSQLKLPVDPNDLLNEAIKYRKLNNAIQKGKAIKPQEYSQIALQGTGDTDDAEETSIDETPVRKSAGESTTSQPKNYITNGTKTTTFDKDKSLTKTSTSNPPANATTVPAPSKKNSSVTARQSNTTRQAQTSRTAQPVRNRTSRAPVQQRRISPTLAEAVIYNRPDTLPVQTPVTRPNTNASGYTKGHEAVFNPRTGRLEFI